MLEASEWFPESANLELISGSVGMAFYGCDAPQQDHVLGCDS
jgi:hypothetical protein